LGAGALVLVALFAFVYGGDVRHHGFFYVLFLMSAWIARTPEGIGRHETIARTPEGIGRHETIARTPEGIGRHAAGETRRWARVREAGLAPTLATVLLLHVLGTPVALYYDAKYIFSSGRRAADALRSAGLTDALLVAEVDYPATAVIGHLGPRAFAYTPRTGRTFSFVKWTRDRHWDPTDQQTLRFAADLGARKGEDAVLIMNRPLAPELVDGAAVTRVAETYDSMIEEENFYIYRVARAAGADARSARTQ
jgi:hypothetical protein